MPQAIKITRRLFLLGTSGFGLFRPRPASAVSRLFLSAGAGSTKSSGGIMVGSPHPMLVSFISTSAGVSVNGAVLNG